MLDILNNFDWKRPIYFTGGSSSDSEYIWLKDYLQLDGLTFKLVPIKTPVDKNSAFLNMGRIDTKKMYENVRKWDWKVFDKDFYIDEQVMKNVYSLRNYMIRLSEAFAEEGDTLKAVEVLDFSLEKLPIRKLKHYSVSVSYPEMYYKLGQVEKARKVTKTLLDIYKEQLNWYKTFDYYSFHRSFDDFYPNIYIYNELVEMVAKFDEDQNYAQKIKQEFNSYRDAFKEYLREDDK